jgi:Carboxypeptidase regulatory-like domain
VHRRPILGLLLLLSFALLPEAARAQTVNATISGVVTDPSGAAIPNVAVTLTAVSTGAVAQTTSDSSGFTPSRT